MERMCAVCKRDAFTVSVILIVVTWVVGVGDGGADGVCLQGEGRRRRHGCRDTERRIHNDTQ